MSIGYTTGVPNPTNDPSVDVGSMQTNTNNIATYVAVDHVGFNVLGSGIHRTVNMPAIATPPVNGNANMVLYCQLLNGVYTLFAKDAGQTAPLFGPANPVGPNGFTTVYGGVLLQWGIVNFAGGNSHETGAVSFATANKNFASCFIVIPQLIASGSGVLTASDTLAIVSKSATNFVWNFNSSSSSGSTQYTGFYWVAIGN